MVGAGRDPPLRQSNDKPLGGLIGAFKTVSTKQINLLRDTEGRLSGRRNYYEHIIRNEPEMERMD